MTEEAIAVVFMKSIGHAFALCSSDKNYYEIVQQNWIVLIFNNGFFVESANSGTVRAAYDLIHPFYMLPSCFFSTGLASSYSV